MRRFVVPILGLALVVAVHVTATPSVPYFADLLDLFLVWTVLVALSANSLVGLAAGIVAGLFHDSLTGAPFGLYGFADTLVGYGAARLAQRLVMQRVGSVILMVAGLSVAQQIVVALVSLLVLPIPEIASPGWLAAKAIACGLTGGAMFYLTESLGRYTVKRRRQRTRRLRLR